MTALPGDPKALAATWIRLRCAGWRLHGQELDDVWADCLGAIGEALHTWREDGSSFATWAYLVMDHRVGRERKKRYRWRQEVAPDPDRWRPGVTEDGFRRVDDTDQLERILSWCSFTEREAEAVAMFAVHGGTICRHIAGGNEAWFPGYRAQQGCLQGARRKMRAAAAAQAEHWEYRR